MASLSSQMRNMQSGHLMMTTVIGHPYPPSNASVQSLKKLMIKDLRLETNHRGFYLLIRFVCPAMRMTAVMNIAEDEDGNVCPFAVYMQEPEKVRPATSILKENGIIVLKEPYFKQGTNGQYVIRVDQPTDIVRLSDDDPLIPTKWRAPPDRVTTPVDFWKQKGNVFVGKASYYDAIEMYSKALRFSPTQEEQDIIYRNRALAYLRVESFDKALNDVACVSDPQEKGLYRKGLALYGLGKFKEAMEVMQILVNTHPESASGKQELDRCQLRIAEQATGDYDFKAMYKATKLRPPRIDVATYKGPVEVRESAGRGRGLYISRAIKAGEMLLCEKAFSYCFAASSAEIAKASSSSISQTSYLLDIARNRTTIGTHADLIRVISSKLILNPSLRSVFEDLYSGDYAGVADASTDGKPVVDTFLVANIIHLNSFGCPLTSKDSITGQSQSHEKLHTTGVWIVASYINHSCNETCTRSFIGDVQIVRAVRDMPAGTELTFSYINRDEPTAMNRRLKEGWGFECSCTICVDDRATSATVKTQRRKLIKVFKLPSTTMKRKVELLDQLNKTYQQPAIEVPRHDIWDFHFNLVQEYAKKADTDQMIEHVLAAFESLGFVVEGARLRPFPSIKLIVRKWGTPHTRTASVTSAFLSLRNVYKAYGLTELAEQAKEFARISWTLLVGDDTTFVFDNPPQK